MSFKKRHISFLKETLINSEYKKNKQEAAGKKHWYCVSGLCTFSESYRQRESAVCVEEGTTGNNRKRIAGIDGTYQPAR